jgi:hypothetical protein
MTFWSSGEAVRFLIAQGINLAISVLAMTVVTYNLHMSYVFGIIAAVVIVPIINFFVLDRWVFQNQSGKKLDDLDQNCASVKLNERVSRAPLSATQRCAGQGGLQRPLPVQGGW